MAKQYKVKDINNNGKIDAWEQGKYDAINNSATKMYKKEKSPMKMGYAMKMGSKENYSPTNFKTKDAMLMAQSPMMKTDPKDEIESIKNFSKEVYKNYEGIQGSRGGYVNVEGGIGEGDFSITKKGLPKGVFQDYKRLGGNTKNTRMAADILKTSVGIADAYGGNTNKEGTNKRFKKGGGYDNAFYAPKDGFRGVDAQTGKTKYFGSSSYSPKVSQYSTDFQKAMKNQIEVNTYGVRGKNKKKSAGIKKMGGGLKGNILK